MGERTQLAAVEVAALPVVSDRAETPMLSTTGKMTNQYPIRTDWQAVFQRIVNQAEFPSLFIYGRQGTGKTTLVNYLLSLISNRKVVLDPHYQYGAWAGCEVIGKGMDYAAIDAYITECLEDIQNRYRLYAQVPNYTPEIVTVVCEELTNWAEHIKRGKAFTKSSLSDFRKAGYQSINVAHSDTNTARGGATGTRKMRDNGEVKIQLLAKGKALIEIPDEEPFELHYPNLEHRTPKVEIATDTSDYLDDHDRLLDDMREGGYPSQIVEKIPSVKKPSPWDIAKAKMQEVDSPLLPVLRWIEKRDYKPFTLTLAKENKQLRQAVDGALGLEGESPRAKIEWAILTLSNRGLLNDSDGSYTQI